MTIIAGRDPFASPLEDDRLTRGGSSDAESTNRFNLSSFYTNTEVGEDHECTNNVRAPKES